MFRLYRRGAASWMPISLLWLCVPAMLHAVGVSSAAAEELIPLATVFSDESAASDPSDLPPPPPPPSTATAPPPAYVSPFAGSFWERPVLLGDLGGVRDEMAADGFLLNVSSTQFYQGVAAGGTQQEFNFSGRLDYYGTVDGEKAGLWKGFFVFLHGETRYGPTINSDTGALMPANTAEVFPIPGQTVTALTGVKFMQALSEDFLVFAGKINLLDELKQPFAAGRGVDAFMNMGLAFPVAAARTVPYSTLGAGLAVLRSGQPVFSMMVLDTNNSSTTSGFDTFFNNGASIIAKLDIPVVFRDRPGHQGFWGTYSNGRYNDLQPTAYFSPNPLTGPIGFATGFDTGSWSLFYSADQALFVDSNNPKRSWGLFTNIGLADDGPSPIRWSANVGLGGSSPFESRPLDTFGVGYAYTAYSGPIQTLAPALVPIRNDQVVELFYNFAVTPWFRLTPDLQVLIPARERTLPPGAQSIDTALVFGVRAKIDF